MAKPLANCPVNRRLPPFRSGLLGQHRVGGPRLIRGWMSQLRYPEVEVAVAGLNQTEVEAVTAVKSHVTLS